MHADFFCNLEISFILQTISVSAAGYWCAGSPTDGTSARNRVWWALGSGVAVALPGTVRAQWDPWDPDIGSDRACPLDRAPDQRSLERELRALVTRQR